jgi:hypothetical protein
LLFPGLLLKKINNLLANMNPPKVCAWCRQECTETTYCDYCAQAIALLVSPVHGKDAAILLAKKRRKAEEQSDDKKKSDAG